VIFSLISQSFLVQRSYKFHFKRNKNWMSQFPPSHWCLHENIKGLQKSDYFFSIFELNKKEKYFWKIFKFNSNDFLWNFMEVILIESHQSGK